MATNATTSTVAPVSNSPRDACLPTSEAQEVWRVLSGAPFMPGYWADDQLLLDRGIEPCHLDVVIAEVPNADGSAKHFLLGVFQDVQHGPVFMSLEAPARTVFEVGKDPGRIVGVVAKSWRGRNSERRATGPAEGEPEAVRVA